MSGPGLVGSPPQAARPVVESGSATGWDPRRAARRMSGVSVVVVVGAAAAGAVAPHGAAAHGPALLVVAGLLGLPHGAVDHLALGWARGRPGAARPTVLLLYAIAAAAAAAVTVAVPLPALVVLLVLSAAHFAEGERAFDRLRAGAGLTLPAVALGVDVVAVPLLLHGAAVRPLLAALDTGLPDLLARVRTPLLVVTALLVVGGLALALRRGQRRVAAELAVVAVATVVGPPLLVFAAWFAGWHAPRHLLRLAALEPSGGGPERYRRLARGAAVPTLVAVGGLVVLTLVLGGLAGAVLVALLALTVPHAAVVARLDRTVSDGYGSARNAA